MDVGIYANCLSLSMAISSQYKPFEEVMYEILFYFQGSFNRFPNDKF